MGSKFLILVVIVSLGYISTPTEAQVLTFQSEYRYMKADEHDRKIQSEQDDALRAFRQFRYSLIRSLRRDQKKKELEELEDHWKNIIPY